MIIDATALDQLFRSARSHNGWQDKPITDEQIKQLYDLVKMGPTSANCCPGRFVFVKSQEAKARLGPCMSAGNLDKTMAAPVTVIVAADMEFYEFLPKLFPHADAKSWFVGNPELAKATAIRNATLQAGYLILAARALGMDTGPMSGFDAEKTDQAFFTGTTYKTMLIVNLGYGDPSKLFGRSPRFEFSEVAKIA